MVTEKGDVVAGLVDIGFSPGVDAAAFAVLLVKIPVQVVVGIIRGLEDGVIHLGAFHLDPANGVVVLIVDVLIAGEHSAGGRGTGGRCLGRFLSGFLSFLSGFRLGVGNDLRKVIHPIRLLLAVQEIIANHEGTDAESSHKQEDGYNKQCFFHRVPPFLIVVVL